MKLNEWLDEERGRYQKVAKHFGITIGAVSQWKYRPPVKRLFEIETLTKKKVSVKEMLEQLSEGAEA